MHCYSSKFAVKTSNIFTVVKLVGILVIIASGVVHVASGHTDNLKNLMAGSSDEPGSYALAFYTANWAFGGVQGSMNIVEEIQHPLKRGVILSILLSQATIITVYCLANVAYVAILTPAEILASDAVAMSMGEKMFSGVLFWVMPFFVSCSTFGNMNNSIMTSSRMIFAASRERHLPRPLSLLNAKYITPIPIFVCSMTITLMFVWGGELYSLIIYTSYVYGLLSFLSVFVLLKVRFTGSEMERPLRLPVLIPVAYLLVSILLLVLPLYQDPRSTGLSFAFIASGVPVYFYTRLETKPELLLRLELRVTHFVQKLCYALPEDKVEEAKVG
jgi:amino acid transporter